MSKLMFSSDYMEGAHPRIIEKLMQINFDKNSGYGMDDYCQSAKEKIRKACECEDAQVHFLVGGTQANKVVITSFLQHYEGVVSADSGHIAVHEAGAIENSGHKVLTIKNNNGKLMADDVRDFVKGFYQDETCDHMVFPGMVYISHPTETGTLYTLSELEALRKVCDEYNMHFFMDGARLGYGLVASDTDVTLADIARLCDVFYIGGTKVGAFFGEAVVISRPNKVKHFFTSMKQNGALLAKGWLLGVQFDTLFTDDLYMNISKNAIECAYMLKQGLLDKGYTLFADSSTNQQFVIVTNDKLKELREKVVFNVWEKVDEEHTAIRFVTSWATTKEQVSQLLSYL